jgi:hypothetical protein
MRRASFLGWMLLAAGCITVESNGPALRARSAPTIGCPPALVTIGGLSQDASGGLVWTVSGCDREAACSAQAKDFMWGASGVGTRCEETRSSTSSVARQVVLDRLSLETGCALTQVSILTSSEWTRGGERSYRMEACGKRYVCTTAPGRTDCKAALDQ